MKKYALYLFAIAFVLCSFNINVNSASAQAASFPAGCTSARGYSPLTGVKCDTPVNSSLPAGCTSTIGYSPTTGAKCDSANSSLPAGCTSTSGYSSTTGERCSSKSNFPPGCASTSGYSSTTGEACNGSTQTSRPTLTILAPENNAMYTSSIPHLTWTNSIPIRVTDTYYVELRSVNVRGYASNRVISSVNISSERAGCSASDECFYSVLSLFTDMFNRGGTYKIVVANLRNNASDSVTFTVNPSSTTTSTCSSSGYDTRTGFRCGCSSTSGFSSVDGFSCGSREVVSTPTPTISCSFALLNSATVSVGQNSSWAVTSSPVGLKAYWYGTKNGSTDIAGNFAGTTDFTQSYTYQAGDAGTYTRYLVLKDASGNTVCTTNTVNLKVNSQTTTSTYPAGCSSTSGFSSTTGAYCDGSTPASAATTTVSQSPAFSFSHKNGTIAAGNSWTFTLSNAKAGDKLNVTAFKNDSYQGRYDICTVAAGATSCSASSQVGTGDIGSWRENVLINESSMGEIMFTVTGAY